MLKLTTSLRLQCLLDLPKLQVLQGPGAVPTLLSLHHIEVLGLRLLNWLLSPRRKLLPMLSQNVKDVRPNLVSVFLVYYFCFLLTYVCVLSPSGFQRPSRL